MPWEQRDAGGYASHASGFLAKIPLWIPQPPSFPTMPHVTACARRHSCTWGVPPPALSLQAGAVFPGSGNYK